MNRYKFLSLFILLLLNSIAGFSQYTISNIECKYELKVSDSLIRSRDSTNGKDETVYYDDDAGIVFVITVKEGIFADNNAYINCTKEYLEKDLKEYQGDSTLKLISCSKSPYYPDKTVVLHFESHIYPAGLNRCVIYFIHHRGKELQFSFIYDRANDKSSLAYINRIMQSLKLF